MTVLRIRGRALPDGEYVDLYADGDRWTTDPVPGAELVAEGWLLPGLVDMHTHPGAEAPGSSLDENLLREDLSLHIQAGVTAIRSPGLAGDPPEWFGQDPGLPRSWYSGRWLAQIDRYYDGWAQRGEDADLPGLAAAQAASTGWAKVIADWGPDNENAMPVEVLRSITDAVHAVGGRIAVHAQQERGCEAAVEAGVDSLEHGMCLDPALLEKMAAQGTALTPTLAQIEGLIEAIRGFDPSTGRTWYLRGAEIHGQLAVEAVEAGVTVLAGTDSRPCGRVADEVRALAAAGLRPHDALAAASWTARSYLGLPGLVDGGPADAVVYAEDPRTDLSQLGKPVAVILRGALMPPVPQ
jgi:imidazolonepropionase-like amidohydrolase